MQEIWKDIVGYEGLYQVSNMGRVRSLKRNIILKPTSDMNGKGYYFVNLKRGNPKKIHRLVAKAFIPNPDNKPEVNHIDGNTKNNKIDNLEWCTHQENCVHYTYCLGQHKGQHKMRPVIIRDKNNDDVLMKFKSINSAIKWIRENTKYKKAEESSAHRVINKKEYSMYGYRWEDLYE